MSVAIYGVAVNSWKVGSELVTIVDDAREGVGPINHGLERTGQSDRPQEE